MASTTDYRVQLDAYAGPLDLLLYLIRKEEVDIYDIPISHVTEQYLGYLDILQMVDVNLGGEFLVMAATLMEIKSRTLLPREEMPEDEEMEDPRSELIRQLLEYKRFKDAARHLETLSEEQGKKFPRPFSFFPAAEVEETPGAPDNFLEGVDVWDLITAFSNILQQTTLEPIHQIDYDEIPLHILKDEIVEKLRPVGSLRFIELFEDARDRSTVVGIFLGLLELVRQKMIAVFQTADFAEIRVALTA